MSFPRYQKYKNSGFSWMSQIPENWSYDKIKFNTYVKGRVGWHGLNSSEFTDEGVHLVTGTDFRDGYVDWSTCYRFSEARYNEDPYIQLKENDLLITKDGTIGKLARVKNLPSKASLNSGIFLVRAVNQNYKENFLYWVLQSLSFKQFLDLHKTGSTIQHLYQEVFNQFAFPLPSVEVQDRICVFLDRETAKIDALVAEQERLIELLKEKRQAIISHAVTKGLNSKAPMKPSFIDWLGDIPAHWDTAALKHIVATPITDGPHETPAFYDEGVPFVSAEAISSGKIDFTKIRAHISVEDHERYSKKYHPKRNDIFMVKSGATTGVTAIVDTDCEFNIWSPLAVIRCGEKALPAFVLHYMRSINFLEAITLNWSFGTQQNIGMGVIENLHLALPPIDEQAAIAKKLDNQFVHFEELIAKSQKAIDLLQERRTALISAAVTGKIDIRGMVDDSAVIPANDNSRRAEIFAEIVNTLARDERRHGQISQMKGTFLVEAHLGYADGVKDYERHAAGPYSKAVMDHGNEVGVKNEWFVIEKDGRADRYRPGKNHGQHFSGDFKPEEKNEIKLLLGMLNNLNNESLEICATLYHCWLIRLNKSLEVTESALMSDFENYSPRKKKFTKSQIRNDLQWMKQNNVTPEHKKPYRGYADAELKNDKQSSLFGDGAQ